MRCPCGPFPIGTPRFGTRSCHRHVLQHGPSTYRGFSIPTFGYQRVQHKKKTHPSNNCRCEETTPIFREDLIPSTGSSSSSLLNWTFRDHTPLSHPYFENANMFCSNASLLFNTSSQSQRNLSRLHIKKKKRGLHPVDDSHFPIQTALFTVYRQKQWDRASGCKML